MNKKFHIIILFLCLPLSIIAQNDYYPLVSEGKTWEIAHVGMLPSQQEKWFFMLSGDTIINGVNYKKLYQENNQGAVYYRAMREEGRKVYCIPRDSQEEHLLFDFGMQVGDSVYCLGGDRFDNGFIIETPVDESQEGMVRLMKLIGTDTYTNKEGLDLQRYHFSVMIRSRHADGSVTEYEEQSPVAWIEGIGSRNDYTFNSWYVEMVSSYSWMLTKCYDNDHLFYEVDANNTTNSLLYPDNNWEYWYRLYCSPNNYFMGGKSEELHFMGKETVDGLEYCILEKNEAWLDSNEGHWCLFNSQSEKRAARSDALRMFHLREADGKILMLKDEYASYLSSAYNLMPDLESMMYGENEIVLYDFTLSVGDKYPMPGDVTIESIDCVDTGHGRAKEYVLSNSLSIVAGVGCVNSVGGLIAYQAVDETESWSAGTLLLYSVKVNDGETDYFYFVNNEKINQLNDIHTQIIQHPRFHCIYDLTGRRLTSPPTRGIYIQNGKKLVVR